MPDDQGPNMEMRAFIAVVLSLAVMLGYQYFFAPPPPEPVLENAIDAPAQLPGPAGPSQTEAATAEAAPQEPAAEPETQLSTVETIGSASQRVVELETDLFRMTVDNRGALISSLVLTEYVSDFGGPLELVVSEPGIEPAGMLSLASPERPDLAAQANQALYRLTINGVEPASRVRVDRPTEIRWEWADETGWRIDKRLTINPDGYLSDLRVTIESPDSSPIFVTLGPGLEMEADNTRAGIYLMKGAVLFDADGTEHIADSDLATPEIRPVDMAWGGLESNYFVALFAPQAPAAVFLAAAPEPSVDATGEDPEVAEGGTPGTRAQFGILVPSGVPLEVPLFMGPKNYDDLAAAGYGLERAVDYGRFRVLARPVAVTLEWLNERIGNYGLAIILATLGVRLVFFPLSQKSMKSMRKMQSLQPQMNAIKAKYKGMKDVQKKQEMNAEVMQLYKDNGVSPLGGCLPMLLQMPVLFGFYAAISVSIISRQAPFALWIQDLSKMDPFYVLPLLMGASMYLQQRMSPGTGDPVQQRIFRLMPVMFTFFFLRFPSGLVIYWLVNTVLGISQQAYVNHQLEAPAAKATPSPKSDKSNKTNKGQKGGGAKRKKRGKR